MADEIERKRDRPPEQPQPAPAPRHIADEPIADADSPGGAVKSPTTETGLPVEEQVRKEWDSSKDGGLPTPLQKGTR